MQIRLGLLVLGFAASPFAAAQADIRPGLWDMSVEFSVPADPAFKQPAISRPQCLTAADDRELTEPWPPLAVAIGLRQRCPQLVRTDTEAPGPVEAER